MSTLPLRVSLPLPPLLKWAGGKRWLVNRFLPLWKRHAERRLVEPFCGALALPLSLTPGRARLNDINPHLIHFFNWVKRGLKTTLWMENDKELYYVHRKRFNELIHEGAEASAEAAALFYYLNRTCFNGLCRFNSRGEFNVPFGRYRTIQYQRDFSVYEQAFTNWEFSTGDFEAIVLEPNDFVYADPPFDQGFTQYAKQGFGWSDQVRTAEWLARHPGPVVASNLATERIEALYSGLGFELRFVDAPRRISSTGDRSPAREVVAFRNVEPF